MAIVHHIPGRLRLRLPPGVHVPELERGVRAHPGVKRFRHSPRARSVVVEYQPTETTADALLELVAAIVGLDVDPIDAGRGALPSPLSQTISRAVATLNAEIAKRTSYHLDMRTLLAMSLCPLCLGGDTDHSRPGPLAALVAGSLVWLRAVQASRARCGSPAGGGRRSGSDPGRGLASATMRAVVLDGQ